MRGFFERLLNSYCVDCCTQLPQTDTRDVRPPCSKLRQRLYFKRQVPGPVWGTRGCSEQRTQLTPGSRHPHSSDESAISRLKPPTAEGNRRPSKSCSERYRDITAIKKHSLTSIPTSCLPSYISDKNAGTNIINVDDGPSYS